MGIITDICNITEFKVSTRTAARSIPDDTLVPADRDLTVWLKRGLNPDSFYVGHILEYHIERMNNRSTVISVDAIVEACRLHLYS